MEKQGEVLKFFYKIQKSIVIYSQCHTQSIVIITKKQELTNRMT